MQTKEAKANFFRVPKELDKSRLDKAVQGFLGLPGIRKAREKWTHGRVLVDGIVRPKGYRVHSGQWVEMREREEHGPVQNADVSLLEGVRIIQKSEDFLALYKPQGVHSVDISGSLEPGVQSLLNTLVPEKNSRLVNRLDRVTSGLLIAVLHDEAEERYIRWQEAGLVEKEYLAVVHGHIKEKMVLKNRIDTAKRKKVKVLKKEAESRLRWTSVSPIHYFTESYRTLCGIRIWKGERHQIRAHLGNEGFPILGDGLYGAPQKGKGIFLHHLRITMPEFSAQVLPPWEEMYLEVLEGKGVIPKGPGQNPRR